MCFLMRKYPLGRVVGTVLPSFQRETSSSRTALASLLPNLFSKGSTIKGNNLLPGWDSKFFPSEVCAGKCFLTKVISLYQVYSFTRTT